MAAIRFSIRSLDCGGCTGYCKKKLDLVNGLEDGGVVWLVGVGVGKRVRFTRLIFTCPARFVI